MENNFISDLKRTRQWCQLSRDDYKKAGKKIKASVFIRCIISIEEVIMELEQEMKNSQKPGVRIEG